MGLFFKYVANSMFTNFEIPDEGKLSPYTAVFIFSLGVFFSNLLFNTILMRKPVSGTRVTFSDYLKGTSKDHTFGVLGGAIWCVGMTFSIIASDKAGAAISYGLASGAIVVASIWGIYYWKEFKGAPKGTSTLLNVMLLSFFLGLLFIVLAR
jgi:glucose uptake protein